MQVSVKISTGLADEYREMVRNLKEKMEEIIYRRTESDRCTAVKFSNFLGESRHPRVL